LLKIKEVGVAESVD